MNMSNLNSSLLLAAENFSKPENHRFFAKNPTIKMIVGTTFCALMSACSVNEVNTPIVNPNAQLSLVNRNHDRQNTHSITEKPESDVKDIQPASSSTSNPNPGSALQADAYKLTEVLSPNWAIPLSHKEGDKSYNTNDPEIIDPWKDRK